MFLIESIYDGLECVIRMVDMIGQQQEHDAADGDVSHRVRQTRGDTEDLNNDNDNEEYSRSGKTRIQ